MDPQLALKLGVAESYEIQLNEVESSNIFAVGYDYEHKILGIQFRRKAKKEGDSEAGAIYYYERFSPELYDEFTATNPGISAFFNLRIKPFPAVFPYTKIA